MSSLSKLIVDRRYARMTCPVRRRSNIYLNRGFMAWRSPSGFAKNFCGVQKGKLIHHIGQSLGLHPTDLSRGLVQTGSNWLRTGSPQSISISTTIHLEQASRGENEHRGTDSMATRFTMA